MKRLRPKVVPYSHISIAMNLARENENLTLKPYFDTVDKLTIGYGRNLEDRGLSRAEAELLLANDVIEAHDVLSKQLSFYRGLSDIRQAVFMDLYHNLGLAGLLSFKKMLRAAQMGDWDEASAQLIDSQYFRQVGSRAMRNHDMLKFNRYFTKKEAEERFGAQK